MKGKIKMRVHGVRTEDLIGTPSCDIAVMDSGTSDCTVKGLIMNEYIDMKIFASKSEIDSLIDMCLTSGVNFTQALKMSEMQYCNTAF